MGSAGYQWALVDLEHGAGDERDTLAQMQALAATGCAAIVRVESNQRQRVHRVLDNGAHGIMFPRIDTEEDARAAVAAMRYPPEGVRGVAFANRACAYGAGLKAYLENSADLLTIVQIESRFALENVDRIAAVPGVDVLFIGPSDLSHSMGILGQVDRPEFRAALETTAQAAARHGKQAGILLPRPDLYADYQALGYRFLACGSDAVLLANAARNLVASLRG
jgi:4-hydroxy-2-oxoheptanedioate aldolase